MLELFSNDPWLAVAAAVVGVALLLSRLGRPTKHRKRRPARHPRSYHGGPPTKPYPGDFTGKPAVTYSPKPDGAPDPGEVVWTWVPFEEDHERGKDRPVLLIGHDGPWLLGLQLSSQDHSNDAEHRRRQWLAIGSGPWDSKRRPSSVRLDRIVRVDPLAVRREGAILDRKRFNDVAHSLKRV